MARLSLNGEIDITDPEVFADPLNINALDYLNEPSMPIEVPLDATHQTQHEQYLNVEDGTNDADKLFEVYSNSLPCLQDGSNLARHTSQPMLPIDSSLNVIDNENLFGLNGDLDGSINARIQNDDWIERFLLSESSEEPSIAADVDESAASLPGHELSRESLVEHQYQEFSESSEHFEAGQLGEIDRGLTFDDDDEAFLENFGFSAHASLESPLVETFNQEEVAHEGRVEEGDSSNDGEAHDSVEEDDLPYESDQYEDYESDSEHNPSAELQHFDAQNTQLLRHRTTVTPVYRQQRGEHIAPDRLQCLQQPAVPRIGPAQYPILPSDSPVPALQQFWQSDTSSSYFRSSSSFNVPRGVNYHGPLPSMLYDPFLLQRPLQHQMPTNFMNMRTAATRYPSTLANAHPHAPPQRPAPAPRPAATLQLLRWRSTPHPPYKKNGELQEVVKHAFLRSYMKLHYPGFKDKRMGEHLGRKVIIDNFPPEEKERFNRFVEQRVASEQAAKAAALGLNIPSAMAGGGMLATSGVSGGVLGGNMATGAGLSGPRNGHIQQVPGGNGSSRYPNLQPHVPRLMERPANQSRSANRTDHARNSAANMAISHPPQFRFASTQFPTSFSANETRRRIPFQLSHSYGSQSFVNHYPQNSSQNVGTGLPGLGMSSVAWGTNAFTFGSGMNAHQANHEQQQASHIGSWSTGRLHGGLGGPPMLSRKRSCDNDGDDQEEENNDNVRSRKKGRRG